MRRFSLATYEWFCASGVGSTRSMHLRLLLGLSNLEHQSRFFSLLSGTSKMKSYFMERNNGDTPS